MSIFFAARKHRHLQNGAFDRIKFQQADLLALFKPWHVRIEYLPVMCYGET